MNGKFDEQLSFVFVLKLLKRSDQLSDACFFLFFPPSSTYFNIVIDCTLWNEHTDNEGRKKKKKEEVLSLWRETRQCVVSFSLSQWQSDVTRDFQQVRFSPPVVEKQLSVFRRSQSLSRNHVSHNTDKYHNNSQYWEQTEGSITDRYANKLFA